MHIEASKPRCVQSFIYIPTRVFEILGRNMNLAVVFVVVYRNHIIFAGKPSRKVEILL